MPLINLKCPNCSGTIQMDDSKEMGFCLYCGNKFLVQDEIKRILIEHIGSVEINKQDELNNLLALAKKKLDEKSTRSYQTSADVVQYLELIRRDYVDKALIIEPQNQMAKELNERINGYIKAQNDFSNSFQTKSTGCILLLVFGFIILLIIIFSGASS